MGKRAHQQHLPAAAASPARARKRARATSDGDAPASAHSFVAVRHPRSALADALEWVGDAVAGELAARVLLARFSTAPLAARVFRSLLLGVVSNRNLALVCERMGYATSTSATTVKERADVVEAVVGELAVRLAARERLSDQHARRQLARHLDALLAAALRAHFGGRERARQLGGGGRLRVSRNMFACLPEEELDEATGELRVVAGSFSASEDDEADETQQQHESVADLLDEGDGTNGGGVHHAFALASAVEGGSSSGGDDDGAETEPLNQRVRMSVRSAMARVGADHVLRASKEVFEVFKIYGMTVLSERVSLALAQPHLLHPRALLAAAVGVTPAELTRQRQRVLSVAHLARCSSALGVSSTQVFVDTRGEDDTAADGGGFDAWRATEERLRANTLRAFVGFHSAVATTSSAEKQRSSALVNGICQFLQAASSEPEQRGEARAPTQLASAWRIPDREPLGSLMQSLGEAKAFMSSKTCDELHQPGERPAGASVASEAFLLRQCDSEEVEDLFATLAKEHERETRRALEHERAAKSQQTKRRKTTDKATYGTNGERGGGGGSGVLAANLVRFQHRRFLFCLEEIVVLFAQRRTDECRTRMAVFERELEPCAGSACFRKWEVSTSTLTLAMRDSFFRLLLHDVCQFHEVASSSKNTRDGTRVTQLRLPLHYTWAKVARRITTEQHATA